MSDDNRTRSPHDGRTQQFGQREVNAGASEAQKTVGAPAPSALSGPLYYSVEWDTNAFRGCETGGTE